MSTPDVRLVNCEACGTEGRIIRERRFPGCAPEEIDEGPCPYCEDTGGEIIDVQPIEMEDLA